MAPEIKPEWRSEHTICSFDVDPQLTARLPTLCGFMQEAAYHHAEHFGLGLTHLQPMNMAWVLSRMRLEIERLPKWGETVMLRTWPSGRDRLFYYRDFELKDSEGATILLASTAWFIIDYKKRERITPEWWTNSTLPIGRKIFGSKLTRLKACGCESGATVPVNYGDLDLNGHVNNVRYIEWILNSLSLEFHQSHTLQSLDVNYLAEAVYGREISICGKHDGLTVHHGIMADHQDLFRGQTVWKPV